MARSTRARTADIYCDAALVDSPIFYGLCTSEEMFKAELKRLATSTPNAWIEEGMSGVLHTLRNKTGGVICLVCLRPDTGSIGLHQASILIHEGVHVWQIMRHHMGEEDPSPEFEAYAIERIVMNLMRQYVLQVYDVETRIRQIKPTFK
jgi:hypothetical protein